MANCNNNSTESYQERDIMSIGPKFRIETNSNLSGIDGKNVYQMYSYNDNNDVNILSFSESGAFRILNDKKIEIIAGNTSSEKGVDIVIAGMNGDVTITAMSNGNIRIKGKNVMIEAVEDLDLKAGRNINATSGSGRILMKANKIDNVALTGNAIQNTFGVRAFAGSPVGAEYIKDVFEGNIDVFGS
jgi:chemotaxis receptor (MCP) glutamine deamidase CheD